MSSQAWAILRTQWLVWLNFYRKQGATAYVLSLLFSLFWYAAFVFIAIVLADRMADPAALKMGSSLVAVGLLATFVYWQGMPLLMASIGAMLDFKKLKVYPVRDGDLYRIELLLRTAMFIDMPVLMAGLAIGLARNPALPIWCGLVPVLYSILNITFGAGLRDLMIRTMARKRMREAFLLIIVLFAALPSFLASRGLPEPVKIFWAQIPLEYTPWGSAAMAALGERGAAPWLALIAFTLLAWRFGLWQFRRNLNFDADAQKSSDAATSKGVLDRLLGWPSVILPDPLGVMLEKELKFLSRVSRFRVVFIMGFTFGLLIWLPLSGRSGGWLSSNFLTIVMSYALLLLSEVTFYNAFGFDRTAAQLYFLTPVTTAGVLIAKNLAAVFFVLAEIALVTIACLALKMPVTIEKTLESAAVCLLVLLCMLGIGNLASTRSPRASNPNDTWRKSGANKTALLALAAYPLIGIPVSLAYMARWAFQSQTAFYAAMGAGVFVAACFYGVALHSSVETLTKGREKFLGTLSAGEAPVF